MCAIICPHSVIWSVIAWVASMRLFYLFTYICLCFNFYKKCSFTGLPDLKRTNSLFVEDLYGGGATVPQNLEKSGKPEYKLIESEQFGCIKSLPTRTTAVDENKDHSDTFTWEAWLELSQKRSIIIGYSSLKKCSKVRWGHRYHRWTWHPEGKDSQ